MDIIQILSFTVVAALLVMSPGPNGILITKTVSLSGKTAGFANVGGFVAGFYVHGCLSILGISMLLVQSSQAFFLLKVLGAIYLCWLGIKSLWEAWEHKVLPTRAHETKMPVSTKSAFFEGFLTNLLNPKVSMFYLAAFPQFMPSSGEVTHAFLLVLIHSLLNLVWFSTMIVLLSKINTCTKNPSFYRWLKSITGSIFIGFGVKLFFLKPLHNH